MLWFILAAAAAICLTAVFFAYCLPVVLALVLVVFLAIFLDPVAALVLVLVLWLILD